MPDATLEVGEVVLQLKKFAAPCTNIAGSFRDGDYSRVAQKIRPGWSRICARVLKPGMVKVGEVVTLRERGGLG